MFNPNAIVRYIGTRRVWGLSHRQRYRVIKCDTVSQMAIVASRTGVQYTVPTTDLEPCHEPIPPTPPTNAA